jgi:hypothetical protein
VRRWTDVGDDSIRIGRIEQVFVAKAFDHAAETFAAVSQLGRAFFDSALERLLEQLVVQLELDTFGDVAAGIEDGAAVPVYLPHADE